MSDQLKLQSASVNMAELDKLAKLLATENITITHKGTKTAYFDVKQRELVLPVWDNLTKELYHMLVLHEVGHALYTNADQWEAALRDQPKLKNAANVIEDARIERMMKVKYPGARRDFRMGYEQLLDRDFFQLGQRDINRMSLGDRLNMHYKIGELVSVRFTERERMFITAIDSAKTFEDVVRIARELVTYMGDKTVSDDFSHDFESKSGGDEDTDGDGDEWENDEGEEGEDGDEWGEDDAEDGDDEGSESSSSSGGFDGDDEGEGEEQDADDQVDGESDAEGADSFERGHGKSANDEITTNKSLEEALEQLAAGGAARAPLYYEVFDDYKSEEWIVSYKTLLEAIRKTYPESLQGDHYRTMRKANIKVVDYLAKEFFIRKAADGYQRAKESKTGIINPDKLHAYKMVDDIFRRNSVVADSKSHGLVMFIDFSGSMNVQMKRTIEQLYNLVMFCRKVNIPHRVFAFSDTAFSFVQHCHPNGTVNNGCRLTISNHQVEEAVNKRTEYLRKKLGSCAGNQFLTPNAHMNLLELFNETMSTRDLRDMMEALLYTFGGHISYNYVNDPLSIPFFQLGGTPLDGSIILSADIAKKFRKQTSTQIVSVVYLTDGDSSGCETAKIRMSSVYEKKADGTPDYTKIIQKRGLTFSGISSAAPASCSIRDYNNKKLFRLGSSSSADMSITFGLLRWVNSLGFTTIGYRVDNEYAMKSLLRYRMAVAGATETRKNELVQEIKKNKCVSIPDFFGFDLWNGIVQEARYGQQPKDDKEEDFTFKVSPDASKGQITKAFIAARRERLNLRSVLQGFIRKIAA